jgi:hypothetical protein
MDARNLPEPADQHGSLAFRIYLAKIPTTTQKLSLWTHMLERIPQASQGTRVKGRQADYLGCLHWACRERRRVLS